VRDGLLLLSVFAAAYCGFALLALSQARHWKRVMNAGVCPKRIVWALRACGYGLLGVCFVLALLRDGASFGSLVWATAISVGAVAVAFTLTWRPAWFRAIGAPFLSGVGVVRVGQTVRRDL